MAARKSTTATRSTKTAKKTAGGRAVKAPGTIAKASRAEKPAKKAGGAKAGGAKTGIRRDASPPKAGPRHVALLRGINVGGNNKVPMKELAALFGKLGCSDVETFIQSGNVLFRPDVDEALADARPALAQRLASAIEKAFGVRVPVVIRTGEELKSIAASNPFLRAGGSEDEAFIIFLADEPSKGAVANLDPNRSPPDEFAVVGPDIYARFPNGVAHSKLTNAYFDGKLKTVSTGRNWRTLRKLIELAYA